MSNSAVVIVEDRDGRVLLLLRGPTDRWMPMRWNLPGGKIDPGETPARAAAREAHEESGLRVGSIVPLTRERTRIGTMDVFLARQWSGHVELLDGEHVSHAWVPRAQAADWDVVPVQRRLLRWYARLQL